MKKILIVSNNLAGGGAEKVLLMLLDVLKPPYYMVDLLLIKNKGVYLNNIPGYIHVKTMIDVRSEDCAFPTDSTTLEEYCKESLSPDYEVEIAFLEGPPTKLIAHHTQTKAKRIAWVHTDLQNAHWTYPYYRSTDEELECYNQFNTIIFVSEGAKQGFLQRFGKPATLCQVITNPTDRLAIQQQAKEYSVPHYPFSFCSVASLCVRKGQSRLLYAMWRLLHEGFRFHLNLVGTGENLAFLKELAHILNIHDNVHFCGFQYNPYPYIADCNVFISSSLTEGFPLVLCEALSLKRPIIATRCSGNQDVLREGAFGLLVENTEEGLYQGMKHVLSSHEFLAELSRRSSMGAASLQYETVMDQILALLDKGRDVR